MRKAEKGSLVVYANTVSKTEQSDAGEDIERSIPFMKGYTEFNVEQIEGLPENYYAKPELQVTTVQRIANAEAFFRGIRADIRYLGDRAFYSADGDYRGTRLSVAQNSVSVQLRPIDYLDSR